MGAEPDREADEMGRHSGFAAVLLQTTHLGVDGSRAVSDSELGQPGLRGKKAQSSMGVGHYSIPNRVRVVIFGSGDGSLFEADHRVVNEDNPAGGTGDRRPGNGGSNERRRDAANPSLRSGEPVFLPGISGQAERVSDQEFDEPARKLL